MTIGKFNILDVARIKISANGKTQTIDMVGPTKLNWSKSDDKQNKKSEYQKNGRDSNRRKLSVIEGSV